MILPAASRWRLLGRPPRLERNLPPPGRGFRGGDVLVPLQPGSRQSQAARWKPVNGLRTLQIAAKQRETPHSPDLAPLHRRGSGGVHIGRFGPCAERTAYALLGCRPVRSATTTRRLPPAWHNSTKHQLAPAQHAFPSPATRNPCLVGELVMISAAISIVRK